jgi:DNA-directed RNA polymerase specialized sigma24 family protein
VHPRTVQAEGEVVDYPAAVSSPETFDEFFLQEHERLFRALYFVSGNRADVEELMQEAFLRLWERWDGHGGARITWLPSGDRLLIGG